MDTLSSQCQATRLGFNEAVHHPHNSGAAVIPERGRADAHDQIGCVRSRSQCRLTQNHRSAHGKTDRCDTAVTKVARVRNRCVNVQNLVHAHGSLARGLTVTAKVQRENSTKLPQRGHNLLDVILLAVTGESMRNHDSER